jgi:toxin FitB
MFLLDTNVVSELRRRDRADPNVWRWAERVSVTDQYLSAMTVFEIEKGAALLARRDTAAGARLHDWIEKKVMKEFKGRILPIDGAVARAGAKLHVPKTRPERDAFIAATASVHRMTVVTRNVGDFAALGVPILNPWDLRA